MNQEELHAIEARCTQNAFPACRAACPLHLDIRAFVEALEGGKVRDARKLLERHLPLPAALCGLCEHPCEEACLRRDLGGSLGIAALASWCAHELPQQTKPIPRAPKTQKLAVLGAGLAGLVAAYDIAHKAFPVTVYYTGSILSALERDFPSMSEQTRAALQAEVELLGKLSVNFVACDALNTALWQDVQKTHDACFIDASAAPLIAPTRGEVDEVTLLVKAKEEAGAGAELRDGVGAKKAGLDEVSANIATDTEELSATSCATVCATVCSGWQSLTPTGDAFALASRQAGEGRSAAVTLHRLMGKVSLTANREDEKALPKLHTDISRVLPVQKILPAVSGTYSEAEIRAEAARCIHCECMQCVDKCPYLQEYGSYPKAYARKIFANSTIVKGTRTANAVVNGCALCGQCEEICPENFPATELYLWAREDLVEKNYMPATAHEFALEDMAYATSNDCALCMSDPELESGTGLSAASKISTGTMLGAASSSTSGSATGSGTAKNAYLFFPGCQLSAARGEQVFAVYQKLRALLTGGVALQLDCCGIPAHWAGRKALFTAHIATLQAAWEACGKPCIICACSSCLDILQRFLPSAQCVSLWEILDSHTPQSLEPLPEFAPQTGAGECPASLPAQCAAHFSARSQSGAFSLQHPCGARHNKAWQSAVYSLAQKAALSVADASPYSATATCCGYGGLLYNAQPALARKFTERVAQTLPHTALCSCIMCHERLLHEGKDSVHLFDVLPLTAHLLPQNALPAHALSLSARRSGRAALKSRVEAAFPHAHFLPRPEHIPTESERINAKALCNAAPISVDIAPAVLESMEARFILLQDVIEAITGIEHTGRKLRKTRNGHFIGSWRPRNVTFWVEYAMEGGCATVYNAWCHRMVLPGSTQPAASIVLPDFTHA